MFETVECRSPALRAGTVTGGKSSGFIKEKELGPPVRRHDLSLSAVEFEEADQPCL
jgi:hypothetical protein